MKLFTVSVSFLIAGLATAQYGGVPQCATDCVNKYLPPSCNNDPTCICQTPGFIDQISCCVSTACDASSQQQALNTAKQICAGANVALPSAAGCSGSASGSASATATSTSASGSAGAASATTTSASTTSTHNPANKVAVNGMGLAGVLLGAVAVL